MLHLNEININDVYKKGFSSVDLPLGISKQILKRFKLLDFKKSQMDSLNSGIVYDYSFDEIPRQFSLVIDSIMTHMNPVISIFIDSDAELIINSGVLKSGQDYSTNWHQDCKSQPIFSFILFVSEDEFSNVDGGYFQIRSVSQIKDNLVEDELLFEHLPKQEARLVILDPSSLRYQHRFTRVESDKQFYAMYGVVGGHNV